MSLTVTGGLFGRGQAARTDRFSSSHLLVVLNALATLLISPSVMCEYLSSPARYWSSAFCVNCSDEDSSSKAIGLSSNSNRLVFIGSPELCKDNKMKFRKMSEKIVFKLCFVGSRLK